MFAQFFPRPATKSATGLASFFALVLALVPALVLALVLSLSADQARAVEEADSFSETGDDSAAQDMTPRASSLRDEARQQMEDKDYRGALANLEEALESSPDNADLWNLHGYAARQNGMWEVSEQSYSRALQLVPDHRGALAYQGVLFLETLRKGDARDNLKKLADQCDKKCPEYRELLAAFQEAGINP